MNEEQYKNIKNRREFMKLGALFATVPFVDMLSSRSLLAKNIDKMTFSTELIKNGEVITAAHWGLLKITLKDGKIINSEEVLQRGETKNPQTTVTGDLVYTKSRIKYPMARKSFLENKKGNGELRGKDEWVRLKYDEAIKLVADKLKETIHNHGNEAIFAGSYGWKSSGALHSASTLLRRFMTLIGGFTGHTGDYSSGASQIIMPYVMGGLETYEQQTSWPLVLENSKIVVIWGADLYATLRIGFTSSDGLGLKYLEDLKHSNIRKIVIDPVRNDTAKFLNAEWIALRPNTDVALMLGIMNELYKSDIYDKEFIETFTSGFDKFEGYLKDKSPEWAGKICGIDSKIIKKLAHDFKDNLTCFMSGFALQRAHHGEQPHWALATLTSMLGTIGKKGGGFGLSYHFGNGGVPESNAKVIGAMRQGVEPANNAKLKFPVARITDAILNPGKTIDANGAKVTYPKKIDFIYWTGGNPICHQQNTNELLKAWKKPSTIVVNEMYWTSSARHADVVFPICTPYERNDITMSGDYSKTNIVPMRQLVEKQFESVSDYDVFLDLSKQFNVEDKFGEGKSEMDWINQFYNQAKTGADKAEIEMPDFATFWNENKPLNFDATSEGQDFVRHQDFIEDPILNPLGTKSGLIEIYSEEIAKMNYDDCPPHATWIEPKEWLGMKKPAAEFHMVSPHSKYRLHSQLSNTSLRDTYAVNEREPILINTNDAKRKGIKNGDIVRVYNSRGQVLAGAVVTDDIRPNVVRLYEGNWYSPKGGKGKDADLCLNGNANCLTLDISSSKLANATSAHTALVNIEKYKGKKPPKPYVFDEIDSKI